MHLKSTILFTQFLIYCSQYHFIKALIGPNVRHANFTEFPFLGSLAGLNPQLSIEENVVCTGALISLNHVLMSEHCFNEVATLGFRLIIGSNDIYRGTSYYPLWFITYDQWAITMNLQIIFPQNDIAIVKLIYNVPSYLRLAQISTIVPDSMLYTLNTQIAGWGVANDNHISRFLLTANVIILTNIHCNNRISNILGFPQQLPITYLCTIGDPYTLIGDGDSGGPLLYEGQIVAVNKGTCPKESEVGQHLGRVNVHVSINFYRDFINNLLYYH